MNGTFPTSSGCNQSLMANMEEDGQESVLTREQYEQFCSPPQYYSALYGLTGTIFQSLIFLVGVTGNTMVVVLVTVSRSLHTTTNCYLLSLAVADIITLVSSVPQVGQCHQKASKVTKWKKENKVYIQKISQAPFQTPPIGESDCLYLLYLLLYLPDW